MRRAQPSADRLFLDLCEILGTGQRPASSIGTPSGSATGLDRVAHVMASTIVFTATCAHQHYESEKDIQEMCAAGNVRKSGDVCARWVHDEGASEEAQEPPFGWNECT